MQNVVVKLIPCPFLKNENLHISGSTLRDFVQFAHILCPSGGLPKCI